MKPVIPIGMGVAALILQTPQVTQPQLTDLGHWVTILNQSALACGVIFLGWALNQSRKDAIAERALNAKQWEDRNKKHEELIAESSRVMQRVADVIDRCEGR